MFTDKKITLSGFSIAEALTTMLIIALVIAAAAAVITRKTPKHVNLAVARHGVYKCEKNCTFKLPEGVKDIFVIAVSGGGGGAGNSCGNKIWIARGDQGKDGSHNFSDTNSNAAGTSDTKSQENGSTSQSPYFTTQLNRYFHIIASSAGGSSKNGECRRYPGHYVENDHTRNCKVYPNAIYKTFTSSINPATGQTVITPVGLKVYCDFNKTRPNRLCEKAELGKNVEQTKTGLDDVCYISWQHKPDKGDYDRYCDAAVFGGSGGNGNFTDKMFCSGERNCTGYDDRGKCITEHKNFPFSIGKPGSGAGHSAQKTVFAEEFTLEGGQGGKDNEIPDKTNCPDNEYCVFGGTPSGLSANYSKVPPENYRNGDAGYIKIINLFVDWGKAGEAGNIKTGFFKNVRGPINIKTGRGGAGGTGQLLLNSEEMMSKDYGKTTEKEEEPINNAQNGQPTTVKAISGGFPLPGKTRSDGTLFEVPGGAKGTVRRYYQTCSSEDNIFNQFFGTANKSGYGKGGDSGAYTSLPECRPSNGSSGGNGVVFIFF